MASWIVHFQIAEKLLDFVKEEDQIQFIVGNIGPDCGKKLEGKDDFYPSSKITHWKLSEDKSRLDSKKFYDTYLLDRHDHRSAFYLGYYVHLLTDMAWSQNIFEPVSKQNSDKQMNEEEFIKHIKRDWYDLDHLYLKKHPDFRIFQVFSEIEQFDNIYLDYYDLDSFTNQIKLISEFYISEHLGLEHEYIYLNEDQREKFIEETAEKIRKDLNKRLGEQS